MKHMKLKLNRDISGHKKGTVLTIKADKKGLPLDRYWRARLKDSELDNCCEIVKNKKKDISKKTTQKTTPQTTQETTQ